MKGLLDAERERSALDRMRQTHLGIDRSSEGAARFLVSFDFIADRIEPPTPRHGRGWSIPLRWGCRRSSCVVGGLGHQEPSANACWRGRGLW